MQRDEHRLHGRYIRTVAFPKIELHVHLEGTVRPETLLKIARRNDYALPCATVEELSALYEFRDFAHFIEVWILTTNALRTADDFRQVVTDYAGEAAAHGAVYLEGIFSPAERVARGVDWDEIFAGYDRYVIEAKERRARFLPWPVRVGLATIALMLPENIKGRNFLRHNCRPGCRRVQHIHPP